MLADGKREKEPRLQIALSSRSPAPPSPVILITGFTRRASILRGRYAIGRQSRSAVSHKATRKGARRSSPRAKPGYRNGERSRVREVRSMNNRAVLIFAGVAIASPPRRRRAAICQPRG